MKENHLVILICILLYYFAIHFYREKKYQIGLIFVLGAVVFIRVYLGSHQFFMPWDERFHALVAKNLMENPLQPILVKNTILPYDYSNWTQNHIWLHKPPMGLWLIAISYKIFGLNEWALRFPSLVMSVITVFFIFKISEKLFSQKVGWLSAFCFSLVALPITISVGITCTEHIDTPFMGFITAAIYCGIVAVQKEKWWLFALTGFLMGCAVLTKWLPGLVVIGVVGSYLVHHRKMGFGKMILYMLILVVVGLMVFLPWQLYIFNEFPREATFEAQYNSRHIFEAVEGHEGSPWFHVDNINFQWSMVFYAILPLFILFTFKDKLGWKGMAILLWILVPVIFFSFAKTKMLAYCLFVYPAIAITFGYVIDRLGQIKNKWAILAHVPAFLFYGLVLVHSYDFMNLNVPHFDDPYGKMQTKETKRVVNMSKEKRDKPLVVFNTQQYIEFMFYFDNCTAYNTKADSTTMVQLKQLGYDVLVYSNSKDEYYTPEYLK